MSHEGIRFVSEETARKSTALERELPRDAISPERVRVNQTEGTGVEIDWKDAHRSHWTFAFLRDACPCATCIEEREASGREPGQPKPQLGLHGKPIVLLDIADYWQPFFAMLDRAVEEGFLRPENREVARRAASVPDAVTMLRQS